MLDFFQHKAWVKLKHVECVCQNAIAGILDDGSALHWSEVTVTSLLGFRVEYLVPHLKDQFLSCMSQKPKGFVIH